jgi:hypothetical protein
MRMRQNGVRTKVALSNPANVSPTRIDNSSVAKANNCEGDTVNDKGPELSGAYTHFRERYDG